MTAAPRIRVGVVTDVPLSVLVADPNQPRKSFPPDELEALADSIRARGVQVPLLVRKSDAGLMIVDGERRWRAAKIARRREVPVLLHDGAEDLSQLALDQLAINNNRAPLTPIEVAQLVADLRQRRKFSTNQIAAELARRGIELAPAEITAAADLLRLPTWAQDMLNRRQINVGAARCLLSAEGDRHVIAKAAKFFRQAVDWRGRIGGKEAAEELARAYDAAGAVDLTNGEAYTGRPVVHFAHASRCAGCDQYRPLRGGAKCMSPAMFAEHNAEAIRAGLGPLGRVPEPLAGPVARHEPDRAERRERSQAAKLVEYFDDWLRSALAVLLPARPELVDALVAYYAAQMPDGRLSVGWQCSADITTDEDPVEVWQPILTADAYEHRKTRFLARQQLRETLHRYSLTDFLREPLTEDERVAIAQACLTQISAAQVIELADGARLDVPATYHVDDAYLRLKTVDQLRALALAAGISDPPDRAADLRDALLQFEVTQRIGFPPDLRALLERRVVEPDHDDDDDHEPTTA